MKVAIYTIAKNEEQNVPRFMDSCQGADLVFVGDTGSTDNTSRALRERGAYTVDLHVDPWRFDVPRNAVLSLLPADIDLCIALDLDEVLTEGWREIVDANWKPGEHHRLRFRYVHSFKPDGTYDVVGLKDFAHARNGYTWRHIVHENVYFAGDDEKMLTLTDLVVEHRRDPNRDRTIPYLDLLHQECDSPTATPRHVFWLARDYLRSKQWEKAIEWFDKFLAFEDTWYVERGHALRWKAKAEAHCGRHNEALATHYQSIVVAPRERDVWLDLGWYHQGREQWAQAYAAVAQGLSITGRPEHYLASEEAWGFKIHDLAALCAFKLGMVQQAQNHIKIALRLAPQEEHLKRSAKHMGVQLD